MGMYAGLSKGLALRQAQDSRKIQDQESGLRSKAITIKLDADVKSQKNADQASYLNELADGNESLFDPPENITQAYPRFTADFRAKYKDMQPNPDGSLTLIGHDGTSKIVTKEGAKARAIQLREQAGRLAFPETYAKADSTPGLSDIDTRLKEAQIKNYEASAEKKGDEKLGDGDAFSLVYDLSSYGNVMPKNKDNKDGITAAQQKALVAKARQGKKPSVALREVGVKLFAEQLEEAAKKEYEDKKGTFIVNVEKREKALKDLWAAATEERIASQKEMDQIWEASPSGLGNVAPVQPPDAAINTTQPTNVPPVAPRPAGTGSMSMGGRSVTTEQVRQPTGTTVNGRTNEPNAATTVPLRKGQVSLPQGLTQVGFISDFERNYGRKPSQAELDRTHKAGVWQ